MLLDTGSPWVYAFSKNCKNCPQDIPLYDETNSSTFVDSGNPYNISYEVGAVSGELS